MKYIIKYKLYIFICILIGLIACVFFKYDENKIELISIGVSNKNPKVEVSYDGIYTCNLVNQKDNYYENEEIIIKCKSNLYPLVTHYKKMNIDGLYYIDYSSICQLIDHFYEEGIQNIVALYMKKTNLGMNYFVINQKGDEYIGYLEENMYVKNGREYAQIINGAIMNDFNFKQYILEDLDEMKNQLEINNFKLVTEDYKKGINRCE